MSHHGAATMWLPSHGQTWLEAAAAFMAMWAPMMAAMMLPAVAPVLWRYGRALREARARRSALLIGALSAGYFLVWSALGLPAFVLGALFTAIEVQLSLSAQAISIATGVLVLAAGAFQLTARKARLLACCVAPLAAHAPRAKVSAAWRHGVRFGLRCAHCCAGLTAVLLAIGMMNWMAMALVTAAITAERLASNGERVAKGVGLVIVLAGLGLIAA